MRINKKHSLLIAGGLLAAFFASAYALTKSRSVNLPKISIERNAEGKIEAKVVFGEFRKSEMKGGKKLWEVYAKTGKYYPEFQRAELENPVVELLKDDDKIQLTAKTATVELDGATLAKVIAKGDVVVKSSKRDATITTEEAQFDKGQDSLYCPGAVRIESSSGIVTGEELSGILSTKEFKLGRNVHTLVNRKK